jgi:hypothetical protein
MTSMSAQRARRRLTPTLNRPRWDRGGKPIPMDGMPTVLRPLGDGSS